ncbi:16S rRNA (adenine(1518)-N(6)/adenine(1519)-N(6))-dimethyltransferase RsmA [Roseospirillum parvum]|uniref:16S rRNA (adenine(1518)-N(6)/adenine(1519)-N(6))- dimethyltransferase RsmA n=1 Tax=Roseospirillum parvum TaxID=83401 RepID=UPI00159FD45E|nr:16S rRNA (adenine(1518)-N(6)/adenine(1519)-N(6))-dimethyltransferase RsmA [Roseospirillum parvum]
MVNDTANPAPIPAPPLPPLREVIARHGLDARKALGQHFLLDANLTDRIARAAGDLGQGTVIEIGPGPGGLTRSLLAAGARRLVAVERDPRCRPVVEELAAAYAGRAEVRLIEADALTVSLAELGPPPRRVVANLPYNVGTPLLVGWLSQASQLATMVLMFQREVAERLTAEPGGKTYGRLSVLTHWLCHAEALFDVNPRAFTPPPKVWSRVVRLTPRPELPPAEDIAAMARLTQAAFGQRRKMLKSSLKSLAPGGDGEALCRAAGLDPTARAETLGVADFTALLRRLPPPGLS